MTRKEVWFQRTRVKRLKPRDRIALWGRFYQVQSTLKKRDADKMTLTLVRVSEEVYDGQEHLSPDMVIYRACPALWSDLDHPVGYDTETGELR